jgi:hypothetical protein
MDVYAHSRITWKARKSRVKIFFKVRRLSRFDSVGFDWGSPPMKRTRFVEQSILFYACGDEVRDDDVSPLWPEVWVSHLAK